MDFTAEERSLSTEELVQGLLERQWGAGLKPNLPSPIRGLPLAVGGGWESGSWWIFQEGVGLLRYGTSAWEPAPRERGCVVRGLFMGVWGVFESSDFSLTYPKGEES